MVEERFTRLARLVGEDGLARLKNAHVAVIGLGAVGSYATEALARAGVGHLRLVDFDIVSDSNINRQLYALHSTLGQPKTELAKARVLDINPECRVDALRCFVNTDSMDTVLAQPLDMVVDAIDSLNPKTELITACQARDIPFISSMGAALRTDPAFIRTGPLSGATHCPLSAILRKRLRRRGASCDFLSVYSTEPTSNLPEDALAPAEPGLIEGGRPRRPMGSLPTITGIFGLILANEVIRCLSGEKPGMVSSKH
ncbi:MAG TPA: tRNA threonylcarbamoyladenosine dehydratase [Rhodospirillaceae bacterium]|nr:MAG: hypothetical protein A2018_02980 [Alphaproteobacteria bacterium GWF2_58_20]HAU29389.1 tRNA threonylcarbamoyladenosine dehydratase [Rhodospirillaceae bacterium]